jgi:hypothetical protein
MGTRTKRACAALMIVAASGAGACEGERSCTLAGCIQGLEYRGTLPIRGEVLATLQPWIEVCHQSRCVTKAVEVRETESGHSFSVYDYDVSLSHGSLPDPRLGVLFEAWGRPRDPLTVYVNVYADHAFLKDGDRYTVRLHAGDGRLLHEISEVVGQYERIYPNGRACDEGCSFWTVTRLEEPTDLIEHCDLSPIELGELPPPDGNESADPKRSAMAARFVVARDGRRAEAVECNALSPDDERVARLRSNDGDPRATLWCASDEFSMLLYFEPQIGLWTSLADASVEAQLFFQSDGAVAGEGWSSQDLRIDELELSLDAWESRGAHVAGSLRFAADGGRMCLAAQWRGRLADCREDADPRCGWPPSTQARSR